jgi:NAD(P)-dependent dehydrogenase (short-subunit alcohol dehydrogenase family)
VSLDDANATYLIVGGVTGIGYAVTEWMMSKGARNLLLVSRHATTNPNGDKLQAQGKTVGCNVNIRYCDVTDENSLIEFLAECSRTLPPIRGIINGAMVLDVSLALPLSHFKLDFTRITLFAGHRLRAHNIRAVEQRYSAKDQQQP